MRCKFCKKWGGCYLCIWVYSVSFISRWDRGICGEICVDKSLFMEVGGIG